LFHAIGVIHQTTELKPLKDWNRGCWTCREP